MVPWNGSERGPGRSNLWIGLEYTGECHDHTGVHRTSGRIYKFFYEKNRWQICHLWKMDLIMLKQSFGITMPVFPSILKNLSVSNLTEKYSMIRIFELNFVGRQPTPIPCGQCGDYMHSTNNFESWLNDPNEHFVPGYSIDD